MNRGCFFIYLALLSTKTKGLSESFLGASKQLTFAEYLLSQRPVRCKVQGPTVGGIDAVRGEQTEGGGDWVWFGSAPERPPCILQA